MPAGSVISREAARDTALKRITSAPKEGALPSYIDVVEEPLEVVDGIEDVVVGELVDEVAGTVLVVATEVAGELVVVGMLVVVTEVVRLVLVVVPQAGTYRLFRWKSRLPLGIVGLEGEVIGMPGCQSCNRILQNIARINFG